MTNFSLNIINEKYTCHQSKVSNVILVDKVRKRCHIKTLSYQNLIVLVDKVRKYF